MNANFPITDRAAMSHQLKSELHKRFAELKAPLAAHREAAAALRDLGFDAGHINTYTAFSKVVAKFLRDVEEHLTNNHRGLGFAEIKLGSSTHDFECRQFRSAELVRRGAEIDEQAAFLMEYYPFEALADEAIRQSKELEAKGLAEVADKLGNHLGLFVGFYNADTPYLPFKAGRIVCNFRLDKSIMGNEYNRSVADELGRMAQNMGAVELEVGVTGMAQSIVNIAGQLTGKLLASRTKLNPGAPIEAVVFKDHMHLRFTVEMADALLAFVTMHKTRDIELMGLSGVVA